MSKYLKPATQTIKIAAPAHKVWALITQPGHLELVHPFCASNTVDKWQGVGAIDYVKYYNGLIYKRAFTAWKEGEGYELKIGKVDKAQSKVVWQIKVLSEQSSELNITVYAYKPHKYRGPLLPFLSFLHIRPMLRKYLKSVVKGIAYYLETGKQVEKNQFGFHSWFTTRE